MSNYPLYDIPYLVRDPNVFYMSQKRHEIEVRNQAIVDDYFIARDRGLSAREARKQVAAKNEIQRIRVDYCLRWYYQEAVRRKRYDFLIKFPYDVHCDGELQCHPHHHQRVPVSATRRYVCSHPNQDNRDLRRLEETLTKMSYFSRGHHGVISGSSRGQYDKSNIFHLTLLNLNYYGKSNCGCRWYRIHPRRP